MFKHFKQNFAVLADGPTQYRSPPAYYQGTQCWEREQQGQISGVQRAGLGEIHGDNSGGSSQDGGKMETGSSLQNLHKEGVG